MYGAIYGDLVGSIYEYSQIKGIKIINPTKLITKDSFFSDDTILTISILDAILHDKDYSKYLKKYISDYKDYKPNFSPYFNSPFSLSLIKWSQSSIPGTSSGNGAMMRISPVGFMFDNATDVINNAYNATVPSHNTKESISSSTLIALIIYYLRNGLSKEEIIKKLNLVIKYIPFTRFNTTCYQTIDNCLYAFFNSSSFEDAIRRTLLMGGDTDTNCAIVGSMAEAEYGVNNEIIDVVNEKIPSEFIKLLKMTKRY